MEYRGITIKKNLHCDTWYARYRKNGKQFYISAKTRNDCYNKLKQTINQNTKQELSQIKENQNTSPTLIEWYNKWIELYKKNVKFGTIQEYNRCMKHISSLHNIKINNISSLTILEALNKIEQDRTRQKVYEFLVGVFQKALVYEIIPKNPMLIIDKPKHKRINGIAFSTEDEKILESLHIANIDMFLICLYQGLRKGEVMALNGEDIDLVNKKLTINKSINKYNQVDTTKNEYSIRTIPIFEKTIPILKKYNQIKGRLFKISYTGFENCFVKMKNKYLSNERYTIHSLRHTFITKCQEANIPLHIIQKWVGHTIGSSVTASVYTHSRDTAEFENIEIYNKKLNSN